MSETEGELIGSNKLGANKLGANKLGANKLGANKLAASSIESRQLMSTVDGREVMSFIVGCAMPSGQSLTLADPNGVTYTYPGWFGLAPAWATRAPTVSERRWVTACLLSRTNLYGGPVNISMRHDTNLRLASTATERATYTNAEGAFFGDLFAATPAMYACGNRVWTPYTVSTFRACALSQFGVTTDCNLLYTGMCGGSTSPCTDKTAPFGSCRGGGTSYAEVITIYLTPTQQLGSSQ